LISGLQYVNSGSVKVKNKIIGKIDFGFNSGPAIILLDSNLA